MIFALDRLDLTTLALATVNIVAMLELVRRRRIHEKYALLWLGVGVLGYALSFGRGLVDRAAEAAGIAYGPTILFVGALLFLLFVCVQLSLEISRLRDRTTTLAQEIGLLRSELADDPDRRP